MQQMWQYGKGRAMQPDELMQHLKEEIGSFARGSSANYVSVRAALSPSSVGLKMFGEPLVAIAAADDPLFEKPAASGGAAPYMSLPSSWLSNAACVISYFLPFTEQVRTSNYEGRQASVEWLHTSVQGKMFVLKLGEHVERIVRAAGYEAVSPAGHPEIEVARAGSRKTHHGGWSEYRAAFASGLGTYSLSGGFITEAGSAGKFGSVVVSAPLPVTSRPYTERDEYCIRCGACIDRCPVGAISLEAPKNRALCHAQMKSNEELFPGYVGCGKCRVSVPCEFQRP